MSFPVIVPKPQYDSQNDATFREEVRKRLGLAYDKRGDLIVPIGKRLAFTSPQGQVIAFGYDQAGNFTVQNDAGVSLINLTDDNGATELTDDDGSTELIDDSQEPVIMASVGYVQTVQADLTQSIATVETEISAEYQTADASLSAAINSEATTRSNADSALSSSITSLTSTVTTNNSAVNAAISQEATTRANADTAAATRLTNLETTVDTPSTGLSARVTVAEGAITTLDGSVAGISSEIVAARSGQANLNARINAESTARTNADSALATRASNLEATVDTPTTGLTARVTTSEGAITTLNGSVASLGSTVSSHTTTLQTRARIFRQNDAPTTGMQEGDYWLDANDGNKPYRREGSSWVEVTDARITTNAANISNNSSAITTLDGAVSTVQSEITAARGGQANLNARITAEETARASGDSANATSITTLSAQVSQRFTSLSVPDFVADGLFWTTASGGSPTTVGNPSSQVTYTDVSGVGRVARVDLTNGNIYLQPKAVIQPQVNRKYRLRCRAKVHANASGGGTLAFAFYINGLDSSYTHTDPSSDWTGAADGSRPSSDASFVEADGVLNFGRIITCTAVSSSSAYWRPRIDLTRSGGSGGVIEVREFLIEEITDIDTLSASVTTNASAIATVDGKLSASYGLTVDANGRIASMKLLSDGTTSSVKFTASTFQVFNGSTDEAPFEVVSGAVKIKSANVGTLNIGSGGLTIQSGSSGARIVISNSVVEVYDSTRLRVRLGLW